MSTPNGLCGGVTVGSSGLLCIGTRGRSFSDAADLRSLHGEVLRVNPRCEGDGRELYAVTEQGTLHRVEATPP